MNYSLQDIMVQQISIPTKLLSDYKHLGLSETELVVILQIHRFLYHKIEFPTPKELCDSLSIDEKECSQILQRLIQKNLLTIKQYKNEQQQLSETYSLSPLWEALFTKQVPETNIESDETDHIGTLFIIFEQEFGRPLSPIEIDTINAWLDEDKLEPALIKAGLREAVLMGKLNFTYIDRILRNWQKNGVRTVKQAREASRNFRDRQSKNQSFIRNERKSKQNNDLLYYNWLEGDD